MSTVEKRIFVGGLVSGVTQEDLREKFSRFGQVKSVEIKTRQNGTDSKTFAYLNLCAEENNFKKCFSVYNNTNWKGGQLKLQFAKESFLSKLEQERKENQAQKTKEKTKEASLLPSPTFEIGDTKAVPGTPIEGKKDWVMGKYSRPMPILHVKKPHSRKIVTVDPSKTTHALKKLKADDFDSKNSSSLTWQMEVKDTEITKKRKGEFPAWRPSKKPTSGNIMDRLQQIADESPASDGELEVVSTTQIGGPRKLLGGYQSDGSDSAGSADTDEIIAQSSRKPSNGSGKKSGDTTAEQNGPSTIKKRATETMAKNAVTDKKTDESEETKRSVSASKPQKKKQLAVDRATTQNSKRREASSESDSDSDSDSGKERKVPSTSPPSSIPRPKFVRVDKSKLKASVKPAKSAADKTGERTLDSTASNSSDRKTSHLFDFEAIGDPLKGILTDSSDSDSDEPKLKKKKKQQEQAPVQKIPEFKGLTMLSDYSDEDLTVMEPGKQSSDLSMKTGSLTNPLHHIPPSTKLSGGQYVMERADKEHQSSADSLSSDSCDEEASGVVQLSPGKKAVNASKAKSIQARTPESPISPAQNVHVAHRSGSDSDDTDDILSSSAKKRKPLSSTKTSAVDRQKSFPKSQGSPDEFGSGLVENNTPLEIEARRKRRPSQMESDDSDFDSNDFALVARKLAAQLKQKQQPKSQRTKVGHDCPKSMPKTESPQIAKSPVAAKLEKLALGSSPTNQLADTSNQKRLQAIAEKNAEQKRQQALIKKALEVSTLTSKSHKFFSDLDSDAEEAEENTADSKMETKSRASKPEMQLFSGSGQESSEEEEDAEQTFRLRPQFEGAKGQKLMALQSRFGRDMRFRLDERFQESGSEDEEEEKQETEETAIQEEKSRAFRILESVLGHKVNTPKHKDRGFRDMNQLRYIPGRAECKHMELQDTEPKKKKKKTKKEEQSKEDSTSAQEQNADEKSKAAPEPEVPKNTEKFYEVSTNLKDLFSGSAATFSFLGNNISQDQGEDIEEDEEEDIEQEHKENDVPHSQHSDSSSDDMSEAEERELPEEEEETAPASEMETITAPISLLETSSSPRKVRSWQDDPRLSAAVKFFKRSENFDEVQEQWSERRLNLIEVVRLRHKRHLRRMKQFERGAKERKKKWTKF